MSMERGTDTGQLVWRKSSHSGPEGGDCVEVAEMIDAIVVRDSKNKRGPKMSLPREAWAIFLSYAGDRPIR
jgi:hypothetical protein